MCAAVFQTLSGRRSTSACSCACSAAASTATWARISRKCARLPSTLTAGKDDSSRYRKQLIFAWHMVECDETKAVRYFGCLLYWHCVENCAVNAVCWESGIQSQ